MIEARQASVLDALEARFGELSPTAAARVRGLSNDEALRGALRLAIKSATLASFLKALERSV
jgi:hypothetical protein